MDTAQVAQTVLRLTRKRGMTLRVDRKGDADPVLHVSPKEKVTTWLREAIQRTKPDLIALLEIEARNGKCRHCGAADWGVIGQENVRGEDLNVWACMTCRADAEQLELALQLPEED